MMKNSTSKSEYQSGLIALFTKGEEIFGNRDEFNKWLDKSLLNSNNKYAHLLKTLHGVNFLVEKLDKLALGYPV